LENTFLSSRLADVELGAWSMHPRGLDLLERHIQENRPRVILEFGSGVSTVCLSRYMYELHGEGDRVYVLSVDQDTDYAVQTGRLLDKYGLGRNTKVVVAKLKEQEVDGTKTTCYDIGAEGLLNKKSSEGASVADMLVVDGPAGESGVRFGVMPLARQWLAPDAWVFMDDALRQGELWVAEQWAQRGLSVRGVHVVGSGLLRARLGPSR